MLSRLRAMSVSLGAGWSLYKERHLVECFFYRATFQKRSSQKKTKSEVIRILLDKGMKSEGYKVDDDRLYEMVKTAVFEISKPQVERLASIS